MTIITQIKSIVESLFANTVDDTDGYFKFFDGENYELNYNDNSSWPCVYLVHPITSTDTESNFGIWQSTFQFQLAILYKSKLSDKQDDRQPNVDKAYITKLAIIKSIAALSGFDGWQIAPRSEEIYNAFDVNADGLLTTLSFNMRANQC